MKSHQMFVFSILGFSLSVDCRDIVNFALGLNMDNVNPTRFDQVKLNCCQTTGITCSNQRVTFINWSSLNLNGKVNLTAITSKVTTIYLYSNRLTGFIGQLPSTLQLISLNNNYLTGILPILPEGLSTFDIFYNQMYGELISFPSTLTFFSASYNDLNGTIPVLPGNMDTLALDYTLVSGHIPYLPMSLITLSLGSTGFTGTVRINVAKYIILAGNKITNVVIYDMSLISSSSACDLSYNPLLNNPNIANLTKCQRDGLTLPFIETTLVSLIPTVMPTLSTTTTLMPTSHSLLDYTAMDTTKATEVTLSTTIVDNPLLTSDLLTTQAISISISHSSILASSFSTLYPTQKSTHSIMLTSMSRSTSQRTQSTAIPTTSIKTTANATKSTFKAVLSSSILFNADQNSHSIVTEITLFVLLRILVDFGVTIVIVQQVFYFMKKRPKKRIESTSTSYTSYLRE